MARPTTDFPDSHAPVSRAATAQRAVFYQALRYSVRLHSLRRCTRRYTAVAAPLAKSAVFHLQRFNVA